MTNDLYQALQQCIALARAGVPLEKCLARYPDYREELRLLLLAATASPDQLSPGMPPAARSRVRQRVMGHWDRTRAPKRTWSLAQVLPVRWAAAAAVVVFLIFGGGAGTVAAAQDSVPGGSLYSVKQLGEEARLWVTLSPEQKVALYSGYVRERVWEMIELGRGGEIGAAAISLSRLEEHLNAVDRLIEGASPDTLLAQTGRSAIMSTLNSMLAAPGPAGTVQEALNASSANAYPCLQHTVEVLRQARERVSSALETIGGELPADPARPPAEVDAFCPH